MDRKTMANEIELFCNNAPNYSYLVRFDAMNVKVDTFLWLRCIPNIDGVVKDMPESFDVYIFKSLDGSLGGIGHFDRYLTKDNKFNKAFYLDPDNIELAK